MKPEELAREIAQAIRDLRYVRNHAWDRLDVAEYDVLVTATQRLSRIEQQLRGDQPAAATQAASEAAAH